MIRCTEYFDQYFQCSFSERTCSCESTTTILETCYSDKLFREEDPECSQFVQEMRNNQTEIINAVCRWNFVFPRDEWNFGPATYPALVQSNQRARYEISPCVEIRSNCENFIWVNYKYLNFFYLYSREAICWSALSTKPTASNIQLDLLINFIIQFALVILNRRLIDAIDCLFVVNSPLIFCVYISFIHLNRQDPSKLFYW